MRKCSKCRYGSSNHRGKIEKRRNKMTSRKLMEICFAAYCRRLWLLRLCYSDESDNICRVRIDCRAHLTSKPFTVKAGGYSHWTSNVIAISSTYSNELSGWWMTCMPSHLEMGKLTPNTTVSSKYASIKIGPEGTSSDWGGAAGRRSKRDGPVAPKSFEWNSGWIGR